MKKLLILLLISGCISQKKLAQKCIDQFPCDTTFINIDTTLISDTQYIKLQLRDSIIVTNSKIIRELKYVESNAKLFLEKQRHSNEINALKEYDLKIILDLNRIMDNMAIDTTKKSKEIYKLKQEINKQKEKLSSANKFKWYFFLLLLFLLCNIVLKWFKPRLF